MDDSASKTDKSKPLNSKTIILILLLIFVYPIGLIAMWIWSKWQLWLKLLLSLPIILTIVFIFQVNNNYSSTIKAINPSKQFAQANNTKRNSDLQQIARAVLAYREQNDSLPEGIVSEPREISAEGADICKDLIALLTEIPVDPLINNGERISNCNAPYKTGYLIAVNEEGKIIVSAPKAELNQPISRTY